MADELKLVSYDNLKEYDELLKSEIDSRIEKGHSDTAKHFSNEKTIKLDGDVTGGVSSDFSTDTTIITALSSVPVEKLTGIIPLENLPQGAIERCVVVADDAARLALTPEEIQKGDTVKVSDTGIMYFVVNETKLNSDEGYEIYTAGSATSVPWGGVTDKPETYKPEQHTHEINDISGLNVIAPLTNGTDAQATGSGALAVGFGVTASGTYSTAVGAAPTKASGDYSLALGINANSTGARSSALGYSSTSKGEYSVAIGPASAKNASSIAIGNGANTSGNLDDDANCIAIGTKASAVNTNQAIALGAGATTGGSDSIVIGSEAQTSKTGCVAIGTQTKVDYNHAIALGGYSEATVSDGNVLSIGRSQTTTDDGTVAEAITRRIIHVADPKDAQDATTKNYVDTVIESSKTVIDSELSSTSENPVQNKVIKAAIDNITVTPSVTTWDNITNKPFSAIGSGLTVTDDTLIADVSDAINIIAPLRTSTPPTASGESSVAIGEGSSTVKAKSVAIGTSASTLYMSGVAIGTTAKAGAINAISVGNNTSATGNSSVAFGNNSVITGAHSVGLGSNTATDEDYVVSCGNLAHTRRIIRVTDPVDNTDAATMGWVKTYVASQLSVDSEANAS